VIRLNCKQVLHLHQQMIAVTGGTSGVRDQGALNSAINHAFASVEGKDLYPTVEEKAARQCFSIVQNHPFVDGNKRTGLFVMLVFLDMNGVKLHFKQQELVELGLGIADGTMNSDRILRWIIDHRIT